ncbi:hypothetical protein JCM16496A_00410 [Bacteroides rodentium JCM 16496]
MCILAVGVPRVGQEYLSFFTNLIIKKEWYVNELCGPQEGGQEWRQGSGALLRGIKSASAGTGEQ